LARLQGLREQAQRAREEADLAQQKAASAEDEFRVKAARLEQEARVSEEIERARAALRPGDIVRVARFEKQGLVVRIDSRKRLATVTIGAVEWELPLDEVMPVLGAIGHQP
jgi:DNA mismatch repair protein MutS2